VSGAQADVERDIERIVDELVDETSDVLGAVVGSADGHPLAARLDEVEADAGTIAAMGAAALGLSTQLVRVVSRARSANTHIRSASSQVWVLDVGHVATLTVFAAPHGDSAAIATAAQRTSGRLVEALTPHAD